MVVDGLFENDSGEMVMCWRDGNLSENLVGFTSVPRPG